MILEHRGVTAVAHYEEEEAEFTFLLQGCATVFAVNLGEIDCSWEEALEKELVCKINAHLDGVTYYPLAAISDEVYLERIAKAREERIAIERRIKEMQDQIDQSDRELAEATKDLNNELRELNQKLQDMLREEFSKAAEKEEDDEQDYTGASSSYFERESEEDEDERDEAHFNRAERRAQDRESKKEARRILRKINGLCHPDRTEDPVLHELFNEARTCGLNIRELSNILDRAQQRGTGRLVAIQLQEEMAKLEKAKKTLADIEESHDFKVVELMKQHKDAILAQARNQIKSNIRAIRVKIDEKKNEKILKRGYEDLKKGIFRNW